MKNCDVFLIFAQNIDCKAVLTSTHNLCFGAEIRKKNHSCKNVNFQMKFFNILSIKRKQCFHLAF